jgi:serine/threonine protein kinase
MAELKLQQSRLDGRFDVLECLGRGSYAEIYVARDKAAPDGAPETVVIKALNLSLQDTPDAELERTLVANFQNEAVALDRVRHPNIISRLGHGTAIDLAGTTFHYIVLEYLPGGDMSALARNHPLSIDRALFYLEQVCSGLAYAHKCGVIHRDIKPQNLLLTADRKTVKIADFGVARLEATEGAITRVGTNIYSAPEHNPLVHTGQLDTASLSSSQDHLTPAADIYSLAKTSYTLLAGGAPRRFAHHAITELPDTINREFWAGHLLKVLQKATQSRIGDRYQTVQEFWEELADAALPPTQPLTAAAESGLARRPSADLSIDAEELTQAPPRPQFQVVRVAEAGYAEASHLKRPRIVVPIGTVKTAAESPEHFPSRRPDRGTVPAIHDQNSNGSRAQRKAMPATRPRKFLVALFLILAFSGMLLATHKYVTSHWNPLVDIPQLANTFILGREGTTTTDVNLRPNPSANNSAIGLAELGSRVRVLSINDNWYEVQVLQHGRPKIDPFLADRGWVNKKYVKFD